MRLYDIIRKPIFNTEKARLGMMNNNEYTFEVDPRANKIQIREAVEKLFNVKVESVNTLTIKPGFRKFRMTAYKTPKVKKAFVKLKDGETIAGFEV